MSQNKTAELIAIFPRLKSSRWSITSEATNVYNCLAWAIGEDHRRWDCGKGAYWPKGVSHQYGIAYLVAACRTEGFEVCRAEDGRVPEPNVDKIVLYINDDLEGSHAAKLLESGMWSSKIGDLEDIEHESPELLECKAYGEPLVYMKRTRGIHDTTQKEKTSGEENLSR